MIIKFLESTHQRYTDFPWISAQDILSCCSCRVSYLRLYIYSQALLSYPITLLALWVYWQYIVLTLKTFIWSHQCNRNVLQSCVVSGQLAAASQCNIKNITILHSSRMQRLLLNQAQKNLMNKLKENGTLKAVHCEIFSSWFLALVRILKMIKMWFILLLLLLLFYCHCLDYYTNAIL